MKSEELMIGDWVNTNQIVNPIKKVTASMINYTDDEIARFEPIPLTAEILEDNEFELQEQDFTDKLYRLKYGLLYLEPYSTGYSVGCSITNYDHFNIHTRMLSSFCKVYYVHELQHVLRLCGLGELANNFKIE